MKNIGKHLNLFILFRLSLKTNKTNKNRADYCNAKRLMTQEPSAILWSRFKNRLFYNYLSVTVAPASSSFFLSSSPSSLETPSLRT